ncbi:MAG: hypothetical protein JWO06_2094 [Bacteroidota bacterium]|nr:hypothetical protein [Bacteroidota bacterium]
MAFYAGISSCEKQSCKNVSCANGQECVTGKCVCANGTEGSDCTTASYLKYERNSGSWYVSESCNQVNPYTSTNAFIQHNSANPQQIYINNLFGGNCSPIIAVIYTTSNNEGNTLQIPSQNCSNGSISGTGSYDDATGRIYLQLDFLINNGVDYQCNETLSPY